MLTDQDVIAAVVRGTAAGAAPPELKPLLVGWARLCLAVDASSLTAHDAVARLYPAPDKPDGLAKLRASLEAISFATPGEVPDPAKVGEALRRYVRGRPLEVGGVTIRLAVAGRTGGRARWRVESVP